MRTEPDLHAARMARFVEAGLYLVTSQAVSGGRTTLEVVRAALDAGVQLVQLREKDMPIRDFLDLSGRVRRLTESTGALLVINDRLDVALAVGADGVHLGQEDFPVSTARRLAPDLIIGASFTGRYCLCTPDSSTPSHFFSVSFGVLRIAVTGRRRPTIGPEQSGRKPGSRRPGHLRRS